LSIVDRNERTWTAKFLGGQRPKFGGKESIFKNGAVKQDQPILHLGRQSWATTIQNNNKQVSLVDTFVRNDRKLQHVTDRQIRVSRILKQATVEDGA
jgi:hypothetical protein